MNNFVFKIFGAPTGFNLYKGNEGEIIYFQNFDNGGKENTKLTIHRMASGKVSYSYLRYNFISSGGRHNSFFGMSVLFENKYCKDIQKIFDLFDAVYKGIIVKNGILLTELKGNPTAQAKYLVRTFSEAEGEVKNIENNIINNLKKHFTKDILPLDSSFLESNSMVKLNDKMGNAVFIDALRNCSWVNISAEYGTNEYPIPNPEFLAILDETIENVQKQIPAVSICAVKRENVQEETSALLGSIQNSIMKIDVWLEKEYKLPKGTTSNSYLQKQPDLKERREKLLEIEKTLNELRNVVETTLPPPPDGGDVQPPIGTSVDVSKTPELRIPINDFYNKNKSVILGIAGVIVLVVLLLVIKPFGGKPADKEATTTNTEQPVKSEDPTEKLISEGNAALQNNNFDKAISKFTKAGKPDLAENAKQKAIQGLNQKAAAAKTPQESITILEETRKYGNDPDRFIAEYQEKINNVAAAEQKRKDDAAKKAEDKKKKKDRKSDDCKIIKRKFDSANPKTEWTASELLKEAKIKLDAGSTTVTMDMCNAIIAKQQQCPDFATAEQLRDTKSYIKRAAVFFLNQSIL